MTLLEAKNKWNVSYETLCIWLEIGLIPDVRMDNGKIIISGSKPFVPNNGSKITVENVRKYILRACMNFEYIDYRILCIEKRQFESILQQLEEANYVRKDVPTASYKSNRNFTITEIGEEKLKKKKLQLNSLGFALDFKYLKVNAEIGKE